MRPSGIRSRGHLVAIVATFIVGSVWLTTSARSAPMDLAALDETLARISEKVLPTVVQIKAVGRTQPPAAKKRSGGTPKKKTKRQSSHSRSKTGGGHGGNLDTGQRESSRQQEVKTSRTADSGNRGASKWTRTGAGVIVFSDGRILTTTNVIRGAEKIAVTLFGRRFFEAKVVGVDVPSGLALIKIEADELPVAPFGDSDKVRVGQIVLALGHPFGMANSVVFGVVSAKDRSNIGLFNYEEFIQTDAAINPGHSGGPLLNTRGEIIGINAANAGRKGRYAGVSFAIPSNLAERVMESLIKDGRVRRALLGVRIQNLNEALASSFGKDDLNGALVVQVVKNSAAEKAGVQSGDIIVEFNGEAVMSSQALRKLVSRVKPGSQAEFTVERDKKMVKMQATLGDHTPEPATVPKAGRPSNSLNPLGIHVEKLSADAVRNMDLDNGGLLVKALNSEALGLQMGLKVGDVILSVDGNRVSSVKAFEKAVAEAKEKKIVRLTVQRGRSQLMVASPLD